jgi:hypothetical protein
VEAVSGESPILVAQGFLSRFFIFYFSVIIVIFNQSKLIYDLKSALKWLILCLLPR